MSTACLQLKWGSSFSVKGKAEVRQNFSLAPGSPFLEACASLTSCQGFLRTATHFKFISFYLIYSFPFFSSNPHSVISCSCRLVDIYIYIYKIRLPVMTQHKVKTVYYVLLFSIQQIVLSTSWNENSMKNICIK